MKKRKKRKKKKDKKAPLGSQIVYTIFLLVGGGLFGDHVIRSLYAISQSSYDFSETVKGPFIGSLDLSGENAHYTWLIILLIVSIILLIDGIKHLMATLEGRRLKGL